jgi:SAM-dependent methyltransferase
MEACVREAVTNYFNQSSQDAYQQQKALLDIPCGGCWLQQILPRHFIYHGADLFLIKEGIDKVDLNRDLPYKDQSFDYVTCFEGLEHIENYHHCLREFSRILKPGGKLLISSPNPLSIRNRLRYVFSGTFFSFPHLTEVPPAGAHVHMNPINLSFLISFAKVYGFKLDHIFSLPISLKSMMFAPAAYLLLALKWGKLLVKSDKEREFLSKLFTRNILLNSSFLICFEKRNALNDGQNH